MSNKARNAAFVGIAAGIIAAPFVYRLIRKYRLKAQEEAGVTPATEGKHILSAYRGKHKGHHRNAHHNGNAGE